MDSDLLRGLAALVLGPAGVNASEGASLDVQDYSSPTELAAVIQDEAQSRGMSPPSHDAVPHVVIVKTWTDAGGDIGGSPRHFLGGWPSAQTVVTAPTDDWAQGAGGGNPDVFLSALRTAYRLDQPDPEAAWTKRHDFLNEVKANLTALSIRSLHFEGAGGMTDLTVPLASSSIWNSGRVHTRDGIPFVPNLPCEEIFAAPDWRAVRGKALISRPFRWGSGSADGGELTAIFKGADGVEIPDAPQTLIDALGRDLDAVRIGEVALVDGDSAAASSGLDGFRETILDENCGSHLAFGSALPMSYTDPAADDVHRAGNHLDFVIGTADMVVTADTREGELVLLNHGRWADEVTP